jgi:hypothetical protein
VRETRERIVIYEGPRIVATHRRQVDPMGRRFTLPEHRPQRGQGLQRKKPLTEEKALLQEAPEIKDYVAALKSRAAGRGTLALRRLLAMVRDYPRQPVLQAVRAAQHYGLYDLERLERMVLRQIAHDYFVLPEDVREEGPDE